MESGAVFLYTSAKQTPNLFTITYYLQKIRVFKEQVKNEEVIVRK